MLRRARQRSGGLKRTRRYTKRRPYPKRGRYIARKNTTANKIRSAGKTASDLSRKLATSFAHQWEGSGSNGKWAVEEMSPFKRDHPFWTVLGGLKSTVDCTNRMLYVRGGEWRVTMSNKDNSDCIVNCWLGFCKDGTDYESCAGSIDTPWSPYIAMEDVGKRYKISKWRKSFTLKCDPSGYGTPKTFIFKIGQFPVDVVRFVSEKKGWPFLWIEYRGVREWHCKVHFHIEMALTFTDQSPHGLSNKEVRDMAKEIAELKATMYNLSGDATMNTMG